MGDAERNKRIIKTSNQVICLKRRASDVSKICEILWNNNWTKRGYVGERSRETDLLSCGFLAWTRFLLTIGIAQPREKCHAETIESERLQSLHLPRCSRVTFRNRPFHIEAISRTRVSRCGKYICIYYYMYIIRIVVHSSSVHLI